jgi:hypothetical protein
MGTPIKNCRYLFKFRCPKNWEDLSPTQDSAIRYCETCRKNVHLCKTLEDVGRHSGECIALEPIDKGRQSHRERLRNFRYFVGKSR